MKNKDKLFSFDALMSQCNAASDASDAANDDVTDVNKFNCLETVQLEGGDIVEFSPPIRVIPMATNGKRFETKQTFYQGRFLRYDEESCVYVFFGIPNEDRPPAMNEYTFFFTITIKKGGSMVKKA